MPKKREYREILVQLLWCPPQYTSTFFSDFPIYGFVAFLKLGFCNIPKHYGIQLSLPNNCYIFSSCKDYTFFLS